MPTATMPGDGSRFLERLNSLPQEILDIIIDAVSTHAWPWDLENAAWSANLGRTFYSIYTLVSMH